MKWLVSTWFFFVCVYAYTQTNKPLPYARNFGVEDGLPSSEVYFVMQDSRGYMWFGTDNGVVRYDGYDFRVYGPQDGLEDVVVFSLAESPEGVVWACTFGGELFGWEVETDRFKAFKRNDQLRNLIRAGYTFKIVEAESNRSFIINSYLFGFFRIQDSGKLDFLTPSQDGSERIILDINFNDRIYWGDPYSVFEKKELEKIKNKGLFPYLIFNNEYKIIKSDTLDTSKKVQPYDLSLGFVHQDKGLVFYKNFAHVTSISEPDSEQYHLSNLGSPELYFRDRTEGFYLGYHSDGGLHHFSSVNSFLADSSNHFLPNCNPSHMAYDKGDNLWITTLNNGIFYMPNIAAETYGNRQNLPLKAVSLAVANEDSLFVGYENDELYLIENKNFKKRKINTTLYFQPKTDPLFFDQSSNTLFSVHFHVQDGQAKINSYYDSLTTLLYISEKEQGKRYLGVNYNSTICSPCTCVNLTTSTTALA
ncbi:MAG: two-component regulator propeller domain-containing protein [Bacteroidota bacterium]